MATMTPLEIVLWWAGLTVTILLGVLAITQAGSRARSLTGSAIGIAYVAISFAVFLVAVGIKSTETIETQPSPSPAPSPVDRYTPTDTERATNSPQSSSPATPLPPSPTGTTEPPPTTAAPVDPRSSGGFFHARFVNQTKTKVHYLVRTPSGWEERTTMSFASPDWVHVWGSRKLAVVRLISSEDGAKVQKSDFELETKYLDDKAAIQGPDRNTIPLYEFKKDSDGLVIITLAKRSIDLSAFEESGSSAVRQSQIPSPTPSVVESPSERVPERSIKSFTRFENSSSVPFSIEVYQDGEWQSDIWLPTKGGVTVSSDYSKIYVRVCPYAKYKKAGAYWKVSARRIVVGEPPPTYEFYTDRTGSLNLR